METKKVGIIRSSFANLKHCPRQGRFSDQISRIEVLSDYEGALSGVKSGRSYIVLYEAHLADRDCLRTIPPWADKLYGVFASRSPHRPNPINICIVKVLRIEGRVLYVTGLDAVDNSILLDIKPYIADVDTDRESRKGGKEPKS